MSIDAYRWLYRGSDCGDPLDRHLLACALAIALADGDRPLAVALGLSGEQLAALVGLYFPHAPGLVWGIDPAADGAAPLAPEELDLRALLVDHGSMGRIEEHWLAHIVARRSLEPNHLWQDLGLPGRADLGQLMGRHFAPLAAMNAADMKWKKFFYRQLCQREGVVICKSPVCDACDDFARCFGPEEGFSLLAHAGRSPTPVFV
ncbi:MAG: nitrogen fixation protein NifQ [Actinomycetota bacterium]